MKFAIKSIVAATAFVAMGLANAGTVILDKDASVTDSGTTFSDLAGSGTLAFSTTLVGALNSGGIVVTAVAPATANIVKRANGQYKSVGATAPVTSLTGNFDGTTLAVQSVPTQGGALQVSEDDGFTNTGGSLSITNLRVDLVNKRVYARLEGANGVGVHNDLYLWDIATIGGATSVVVQNVPNVSNNTLSGLSIQKPAFDLFAQSLGLLPGGLSALQTVTDYGTITSTISVTASVPEASSMAYALMGLGVVGFIAARRRAAK